VVDQSVTAAQRAGSFVNAVLRRYLRERDALHQHLRDHAAQNPEAWWNYPSWWVRRVQRAYPKAWEAVLRAGNQPPPMTLRVNARQMSRDAYLPQLQAVGIDAAASTLVPEGVVLRQARPVQYLPGFAQGAVSVQDAAAQMAAHWLDVSPGQYVLDACAAPGGKAAHILERVDCDLLALDCDATRVARIEQNFQRLTLHGSVMVGDAAHPALWWDGRCFDRILADVPCTASGIVRRHADLRWLRRESDIAQLATTAQRIIEALWSLLKPGGKLLLATCSIFPEEGKNQLRRFLERHGDARALPEPTQMLPDDHAHAPTDTYAATHDGFFYGVLEKHR
jgi:16S rRNA (cytosine967-C5)-methyltransferase